MKEAKRTEVEAFLRTQGYQPGRDSGPHTWWTKPDAPSISLPRHTRVSPGVVRKIEKAIGFVPKKWK